MNVGMMRRHLAERSKTVDADIASSNGFSSEILAPVQYRLSVSSGVVFGI